MESSRVAGSAVEWSSVQYTVLWDGKLSKTMEWHSSCEESRAA